eukprot:gnl/TRDRNA2_/TRDRNA2_61063_c0_seq1.p1 gnl/TRDRNA2_/TRDRNA2_61063_c0~~gnl/TRDRNA2_/TRDRNA2_61063_c0_seq1.p1  ORF type:complete len:342 (+),score=53.08 gnl/TRDRNA2_/TRDRNA2_61063_c0_seq1:72-1097(+)
MQLRMRSVLAYALAATIDASYCASHEDEHVDDAVVFLQTTPMLQRARHTQRTYHLASGSAHADQDVPMENSAAENSTMASYFVTSPAQETTADAGAIKLVQSNASETQRQILCDLARIANGKYRWSPPAPPGASCAVVSSSGALKKTEHGPDIDNHDIIIRFNDAPTKGFEKYVGHSTGANGALSIRYGYNGKVQSGEAWITGPGQMLSALNKYGNGTQLLVSKWWKSQQDIQQYIRDKYEIHGKPEISTGVNGMIFALSNCATVDAYEMVPSLGAVDHKYHYYNQQSKGKRRVMGSSANMKWEHDLWEELSTAPFDDSKYSGKTSYPGFATLDCPGIKNV